MTDDSQARRASDSDVFVKIATLEEGLKSLVSAIHEGREETAKIWQAVHEMSGIIQKQNETFLSAGKPEWRTLIGAIGLLMAIVVPVSIFLINQNVVLSSATQKLDASEHRITDISALNNNAFQSLEATVESIRTRQMATTDRVTELSATQTQSINALDMKISNLNTVLNMEQDQNDRTNTMVWKKVFETDLPPRSFRPTGN